MSSRFDWDEDDEISDLIDTEVEQMVTAWQLIIEAAPFITDPELLFRMNSFLATVENRYER